MPELKTNLVKRSTALRIKVVVLLLLLSSNLFFGCALFKKKTPAISTLPERTWVFQRDILKRALFFSSMRLSGRLKLQTRDREFPWVRINAWLVSGEGESYLRIKGFAAFGITVFDLLAKGERVWIDLPRSGKVYEGSRFFTSYGSINVKTAIHAMEMILNPWSPIRYISLEEVPCQKKEQVALACLKGQFMGHTFTFEYALEDLLPHRFYSKEMEVLFSGKTGANGCYPWQVQFFLSRAGIRGRLIVSNIRRVDIGPESQLFDQAYFLGKKEP